MTTSEGIRAVLSWLATYGLHSTLFLGGAWLLCALRPPKANRNRERVWKLALVGGVVSASLQLAVGLRPLLGHIEWAPANVAETEPEARASKRPTLAAVEPKVEPATRRAERSKTVRADSPRREPRFPAARPTRSDGHGPALIEPDEERAHELDRASDEPVRPASVAAPVDVAVDVAASDEEAIAAPLEQGSPAAPAARTTDLEPGQAAEPATNSAPEPRLELASSASAGLAARTETGPSSVLSRWAGLVLLGWIAVGLVGLLGLAASWTCLRRRMLGRQVLRAGALLELFEDLRARAGLKRAVRLSVSARIRSPFSTGFFRPEVCVPSAVLTDLTRSQQEALLAHELAHLVRRDPAWFGLGFLIETLLFFQPLNRIARRELAELAELACDDWAVRWTGARLALASCLTEVAGWVVGEPRRLVSPPGLAGQRSRLGQRVMRLLDDRRSPAGEPPTPWWPTLAGGAVALVVLAMPGVSAARESTPEARVLPEPEPSHALARTKDRLATPTSTTPSTSEPLRSSSSASTSPRASAAPARSSAVLEVERDVLESELALLESELAALRAELEVRALGRRFSAALTRIDARMTELRAQHQQVHALLERLAATSAAAGPNPHTPALAPAPPDEAPLPIAQPGDFR